MRSLRRLLFYLLLVAVLVFWTVFTIQNPSSLTLTLLEWESWSLPIAIWLLVAFVIGGLFGILLCASGYIHGRATQRQLQLELDRSRDELHKAEESPSAPQPVVERPMRNVSEPGSNNP